MDSITGRGLTGLAWLLSIPCTHLVRCWVEGDRFNIDFWGTIAVTIVAVIVVCGGSVFVPSLLSWEMLVALLGASLIAGKLSCFVCDLPFGRGLLIGLAASISFIAIRTGSALIMTRLLHGPIPSLIP
ncbi:MAG: hypothetical protein AAF236_03930 [Verrucomicrobiota bacterium]